MSRLSELLHRLAFAVMGLAFLGFALTLALMVGTEVLVAEVIFVVTGVLLLVAAAKLPIEPGRGPKPERDAFGR